MDGEIKTRIVRRKLASLKPLENNARFMTPDQFERLTENLKRDGVLTSLPLVYEDTIVSGNHRVAAALQAGIIEGDVIEITSKLSPSRFVALQLSHNSITGQDDPNILAGLYQTLDLGDKIYSGLDDSVLDEEALNVNTLAAGALAYREVLLSFLPAQLEEFTGFVERIKNRKTPLYAVANADDFDDFFDAICRVKEDLDIVNTSQAILALARLAGERLDQLDKEDTDGTA